MFVHFHGAMSPTEVRDYMEKSDIFIFTSDRNEGWGAVLNESMNSACAVVASDAIGAVPYLIEDGKNGIVFKHGRKRDFCNKVVTLINDVQLRRKIQREAYFTIHDVWNPKNAAKNLVLLMDCLLVGKEVCIDKGPGSPAPLVF